MLRSRANLLPSLLSRTRCPEQGASRVLLKYFLVKKSEFSVDRADDLVTLSYLLLEHLHGNVRFIPYISNHLYHFLLHRFRIGVRRKTRTHLHVEVHKQSNGHERERNRHHQHSVFLIFAAYKENLVRIT